MSDCLINLTALQLSEDSDDNERARRILNWAHWLRQCSVLALGVPDRLTRLSAVCMGAFEMSLEDYSPSDLRELLKDWALNGVVGFGDAPAEQLEYYLGDILVDWFDSEPIDEPETLEQLNAWYSYHTGESLCP